MALRDYLKRSKKSVQAGKSAICGGSHPMRVVAGPIPKKGSDRSTLAESLSSGTSKSSDRYAVG